ncbi:trypsin-like peptidase domain-containing protein [Nannocystis sp.]|uniref:S1C family serine protease n=1 Tax=Nannocystis sp. TaxID=1962667 RepID=UPI0025CE94C9|nr:trypsin-like peptidase domain-containing protein [Nannocystis sp.]MBK7824075.1 trypsin-like peptidase domain-containing protein [Nannocystis sp.]
MARDDRTAAPARGEPMWLAAGAAVFGVLLGGLAVFLGMQEQPPAHAPAPVTAPPTAVLPELPQQAPAEEHCVTGCSPGKEGSLVEAVALTREMVVTLRSKDTIGAGVVVDDTGLVLTNFHVIAGEIRDGSRRVLSASGTPEVTGAVRARFADGRELPAVLLVADRDQDIALLQLRPADSAERFAAARLGRSSALRVGEGVFSVGTPLGLEHSVSQGIVAALGRTHILRSKQTPLIQLDASINIGNSGGPLFNLRGELVGVTTATIERAQGIAFAIPVDHIFTLLRALKQGELARSGQIGVEVDSRIAVSEAAAGLGYRNGLVLQQVFAGQPAAQAGLQAGDIIVEARGQRFDAYGAGELARARLAREFVQMVRGLIPGETLALTVLRGETRLPVTLVVAAAPADRQVFIDAEELLGLLLDEKITQPTVDELRPLAPITHWRGREQLLGARLSQIAGVRVQSIHDLRSVLTELRQLGREGTVAISFTLKDGRELPIADFPVSSP